MRYSGQKTFSFMYADREWISVYMPISVIHEFVGKWTMELDVTYLELLDTFFCYDLAFAGFGLEPLSSLVVN